MSHARIHAPIFRFPPHPLPTTCRDCLRPLRNSAFGRGVTTLALDFSLLKPLAVHEFVALFPGVITIRWSNIYSVDRDLSLACLAARLWPGLSGIVVG